LQIVYLSFFVGLGLLSASWLIVPLLVASILLLYARIGKEEAMMIERFGNEHRAYMQRTGRFLPRLARAPAETGNRRWRGS